MIPQSTSLAWKRKSVIKQYEIDDWYGRVGSSAPRHVCHLLPQGSGTKVGNPVCADWSRLPAAPHTRCNGTSCSSHPSRFRGVQNGTKHAYAATYDQ